MKNVNKINRVKRAQETEKISHKAYIVKKGK